MKKFRKWTLGVVSGFSQTLSEFENHEAVSSAALADMRRSLAHATAHSSRLEKEQERLIQEAKQADKDTHRWRERAKNEARKEAALECLRRARRCEDKAESLFSRVEQGRDQVQDVQARVKQEEKRYLELLDKHRLFQARDAAAQASAACDDSCGGGPHVDQVFERWEMRITEKQYRPLDPARASHADAFSDEYDQQEEDESLLRQWRELRGDADPAAADAHNSNVASEGAES